MPLTLAPPPTGHLTVTEPWIEAARQRDAEATLRQTLDPDVPDHELARMRILSFEQLMAMLSRRPLAKEARDRANHLLRSAPWGNTRGGQAHAAMFAQPGLAEWELLSYAHSIRPDPAYYDAVRAAIRHPNSTTHVAITALLAGGCLGKGSALESEIGRTGSLSAAAIHFATRSPEISTAASLVSRQTVALEIAQSLEATLRFDTETRKIVAALGPTWPGDLDDLIHLAPAIAA